MVRRKAGFAPRTDLLDEWACMPMEATDPCKVGAVGSTPLPSAGLVSRAPMLKWKSFPASNWAFRVRVLVGVLINVVVFVV